MTRENSTPTNLRSLMIMEVIGLSDQALTVTEINQHVQLPTQTVYRLVKTLETEGFLLREGSSNRFRPSRRSRLIGAGLLHASRVHITRHQILLDVAAEVKETVNFVVPEETGMHYLDRVETDWPFRIQMPRGFNVPFHCTASGKTFMASLSKSAREQFVAGLRLNAQTPNTHTTAESLLKNLQLSAKRGFALDEEEFVEDMVAAAVPVTDHKGRFVAALAVHGPKQRLSIAQATDYVGCLQSAADRLTQAIFK